MKYSETFDTGPAERIEIARLMAENERLNDILREWIAADDAYNEIDYPGSRRFDRLEAAKAEARAALKGEPK